ncbi:hypothetical protein FQR65_LT08262 [Abscondita terminalis]|nr:hypothetical protein FQR65_LT08262 [Abscondita terminalis]
MVFKCQSDSFLKEFTSTVVSCTEAKLTTIIDGKEQTVDGYEVILNDTILFPEGGGQPADHGLINDSQVLHVKRVGDKAVHFVDKFLEIGVEAKQNVNWERRFDHMQQHSGQHLLSAIIETDYGFDTLSWYLGEQVSYIELDTPSFDSQQILETENKCNELIRSALNVTVDVYQTVEEVKAKNVCYVSGLPDDHVGDVRVVKIDGIDNNKCCGTHVTNTSQLQVIKLLGTEKSKRKNKILLHFLVGNRVIQRLDTCLKREAQLTVILKNNAVEHVNLVDKLLKNVKVVTKDLQTVLKELVIFEAAKFKAIAPQPKYYILHRKEGEADFMHSFIKEVGPTDTLFFLSVGDDKTTGSIMLRGNDTAVLELSKTVLELLDGKGVVKNNCLNAKVTNMKARNKVATYLNDYFNKGS